jgi:hypothetical protein
MKIMIVIGVGVVLVVILVLGFLMVLRDLLARNIFESPLILGNDANAWGRIDDGECRDRDHELVRPFATQVDK